MPYFFVIFAILDRHQCSRRDQSVQVTTTPFQRLGRSIAQHA
jgi:hypothetical protein